ncbi:MAG: ABC transporter substrate-binding protein [Thermodesulfobacteriota bacterium]|nr:ABC transporter substrate-binding protein [Thermodesulfobacteriota bacterium]
MKRKSIALMIGVFSAFFLLTTNLQAVEYVFAHGVDYTGPFSKVMPPIDEAAVAFIAWWNDNIGKEIGVTVKRTVYDCRYDPAVVASQWPTIVAKDKPFAWIGIGAPYIVPIMKRLATDKVVATSPAPSYGFVWRPGLWVFQNRPTYAHEMAALLTWLHENRIKDRPIRIGAFYTKVTAFVDMYDGIAAFAKQTPWLDLVGVEWVPMEPVSLLSQLMRLKEKKPDYIIIQTNTYQTKAVFKAQKQIGVKIPVLLTTHDGIQMTARASGGYELLEGNVYEVDGVDPGANTDSEGAKVFLEYKKKLGLKTNWSVMSSMQGAGDLMFLTALEKAVKKKGPDNVKGDDIYEAMYTPFTEKQLLGLSADLLFTKEAGFPMKSGVKITTVKNGKPSVLTKDWVPVPKIPNYVKKKKAKN